MYIFRASISNGASSINMGSPTISPVMPVRNTESRTIMDKIINCIVFCIPIEFFLWILYIALPIIPENRVKINRDSYLKKPTTLNTRIEETIPAIVMGIKYDLIFSENP